MVISELSIYSDMTNTEHKSNISDQSLSQFYKDIEDTLPINMPSPQGQAVKTNKLCDAADATDLITRRSSTGIIFIVLSMRSDKIPSNAVHLDHNLLHCELPPV